MPSLDPVYLDPERNAQSSGDDRRQWRHEQVAAENEVNRLVCLLPSKARRANMRACFPCQVSCRTPAGKRAQRCFADARQDDHVADPITSASADKKSRLYCAIPPCPPNASVTSARTRNPELRHHAADYAAAT